MIEASDVATYLRSSPDQLDSAALEQIVDTTVGLVIEVTGTMSAYPARVRAIALEVAARAYRNPERLRTRTDGPFSKTFEISERAGVYLAESERIDLLASVTGSPTAASQGAWAGSMPYLR